MEALTLYWPGGRDWLDWAMDGITLPDIEKVEEQPLNRLFREQADGLRGFLARLAGPELDVEDLLQEVFMVALRRANDFPDQTPPARWLYGVAVRVTSGARRAARVRRFLGLEQASEVPAPGTPASVFESEEDARRVYSVLNQMAEKKRSVFILFELEGLTGPEIAEVLACPLKTVWSRLGHAREEFLAGMQRWQARDQEAESLRRSKP
jgi:RNA polymerase sigma-70 factor, ECF subfamily